MRVLLTASTNLHRPTGKRESPLFLVGQRPNWSAELTERLRQWQAVYVLDQDLGQGMLKGRESELLIRLRREHPKAVMVIKTDGARKRAFKAPGPNEPQIPPFAPNRTGTMHGKCLAGFLRGCSRCWPPETRSAAGWKCILSRTNDCYRKETEILPGIGQLSLRYAFNRPYQPCHRILQILSSHD